MGFYRAFGKRAVDILLSVLLLIVFSPVILLVSILIVVRLGRPILFRQERPGQFARIFTLIKFRTMRDAMGPDGQPLPDEHRLTPLGKMLRAWSVDELPELLNVLKGDMSLVGPRPLLVKYLPLYTPEQNRRHLVKPGLTGVAQTSGRNQLGWSERFALDTWYVDNLSFAIDMKCLARTLVAVLRRQGISESGHVTAREFTRDDVTSDQAGVRP